MSGKLTLISSATASSSSSVEFTSGIDSTYDEYQIWYLDINPSTNNVYWEIQFSTDGGSSYGVAVTNAFFDLTNHEADYNSGPTYQTGEDVAQSTSYFRIARSIGNGSDETASGTFTLYSPSSSSKVKHFIARSQQYRQDDASQENYVAGYANTTSPIDAVSMRISSGNFDGQIYLFGVS